ncbi:hypothetical protein [Candidatus Alkanophaga liquidiphilum]
MSLSVLMLECIVALRPKGRHAVVICVIVQNVTARSLNPSGLQAMRELRPVRAVLRGDLTLTVRSLQRRAKGDAESIAGGRSSLRTHRDGALVALIVVIQQQRKAAKIKYRQRTGGGGWGVVT